MCKSNLKSKFLINNYSLFCASHIFALWYRHEEEVTNGTIDHHDSPGKMSYMSSIHL